MRFRVVHLLAKGRLLRDDLALRDAFEWHGNRTVYPAREGWRLPVLGDTPEILREAAGATEESPGLKC